MRNPFREKSLLYFAVAYFLAVYLTLLPTEQFYCRCDDNFAIAVKGADQTLTCASLSSHAETSHKQSSIKYGASHAIGNMDARHKLDAYLVVLATGMQ
jgi:hypothetical protein